MQGQLLYSLLLPLMIRYFGLVFTLILMVLVIVSAWVQGLLVDKLNQWMK